MATKATKPAKTGDVAHVKSNLKFLKSRSRAKPRAKPSSTQPKQSRLPKPKAVVNAQKTQKTNTQNNSSSSASSTSTNESKSKSDSSTGTGAATKHQRNRSNANNNDYENDGFENDGDTTMTGSASANESDENQQRIDILKDKVRKYAQRVKSLQGQVSVYKQRAPLMEKLDKENKQLRKDLETKSKELTQIKSAAPGKKTSDSSSSSSEADTQTIRKLQQSVTTYQKQVKDKEVEIKKLSLQVQQLEKQSMDLKISVSSLKQKLSAKSAEITPSSDESPAATVPQKDKEALNKLQTEKDALQAKYTALQARMETTNKQYTDAQSENEKLESKVSLLQQSTTDQNTHWGKKELKTQQLLKQVAALQKTIEDNQGDIKKSEHEEREKMLKQIRGLQKSVRVKRKLFQMNTSIYENKLSDLRKEMATKLSEQVELRQAVQQKLDAANKTVAADKKAASETNRTLQTLKIEVEASAKEIESHPRYLELKRQMTQTNDDLQKEQQGRKAALQAWEKSEMESREAQQRVQDTKLTCVRDTKSLRDENASVERNLLLQNEIVNRLQAQIKARDVKLMESAEQVTLLRIELGQREAYLLSASRLEELKSKVAVDSVRTEMKWREKLYLRQITSLRKEITELSITRLEAQRALKKSQLRRERETHDYQNNQVSQQYNREQARNQRYLDEISQLDSEIGHLMSEQGNSSRLTLPRLHLPIEGSKNKRVPSNAQRWAHNTIARTNAKHRSRSTGNGREWGKIRDRFWADDNNNNKQRQRGRPTKLSTIPRQHAVNRNRSSVTSQPSRSRMNKARSQRRTNNNSNNKYNVKSPNRSVRSRRTTNSRRVTNGHRPRQRAIRQPASAKRSNDRWNS